MGAVPYLKGLMPFNAGQARAARAASPVALNCSFPSVATFSRQFLILPRAE